MIFTNLHKLTTNLHELGRRRSGQALLELSLLGSLILLLLGVLISYGLRYNYQQQAQMKAFRTALEMAYQTDIDGKVQGSASYTLIKDRHIPDPSSPFGAGQITPIMASAGVTRDNLMSETADDYEGLPKMVLHFQGKENGQVVDQEHVLATAGLRDEGITVPNSDDEYEDLQRKYHLIYGSIGGWCDDCGGDNITIKILDSIEGQIVDYSSAIRQARLIVDQDFCIQECVRGKKPDSETDCDVVCARGIAVPWYIQDCEHNGSPLNIGNLNSFSGINEPGDTWYFPRIENLFVYNGKKVQSMGLQPDTTQQINTDFSMRKIEDGSGITTTDDINWSTTTDRTILYNDHLDYTSGYADPEAAIVTQDYSTTWSDESDSTWETEWE